MFLIRCYLEILKCKEAVPAEPCKEDFMNNYNVEEILEILDR